MYIKVRVKTGQKKEIVEQVSRLQAIEYNRMSNSSAKTSFKISVKERAERNSANARIVKIIAERLGVPAKKVRIMSGHHTKSKLLSVAE